TTKASDGIFTRTSKPGGPFGPLDQFGPDDYNGTANAPDPAIKSISGKGYNHILYDTVAYDPNFFMPPSPFTQNDLRISLRLPFTTVDPSRLFDNLMNPTGLGTPGPAPAE